MATRQVTRNIALTPHLDEFVKQKVESGRYQSASEVVREGLRLMEQAERERQSALMDVRREIREGYLQVKAGQTVDAGEVLREISVMSREGRRSAKLRSRANSKPSSKPQIKSNMKPGR